MFKSRIGSLKVFEKGEYHTIKGFKVAFSNIQIESRKVLARDNLKVQTTPNPLKSKTSYSSFENTTQIQQNKLFEEPYRNQSKSQINEHEYHSNYSNGKGNNLDSTLNTRNNISKDQSQDNFESFNNRSIFDRNCHEDIPISNDKLLQEVMEEIEYLESASKASKCTNLISKQTFQTQENQKYEISKKSSNNENYMNHIFQNEEEEKDYYQDPYLEHNFKREQIKKSYSQQNENPIYDNTKSVSEPVFSYNTPTSNHGDQSGSHKTRFTKHIDTENSPFLFWETRFQKKFH